MLKVIHPNMDAGRTEEKRQEEHIGNKMVFHRFARIVSMQQLCRVYCSSEIRFDRVYLKVRA